MATKKPQKRSNTSKPKVGNLKSFKLKPWHVLSAIALFIVGGFVIAYSRAASDTAQNLNVVPLIQLEDGTGSLIAENQNGVPTYVNGPRSVQLTRDGSLYCFAENADSGVTSRLNSQEVNQLISNLKASGLEQVPVNSQNPVVDMKFVSFVDPSTNQVTTYNFAGSADTPGMTKAKSHLEAACQKKASTTKRKDAPKVLRSVERQQSPTSFNPVIRQLVGVARAAEAQNYVNTFNFSLIQYAQYQRTSRGLPAYNVMPCLANSAANWSLTMADAANARFNKYGSYLDWKTLIWHSNFSGITSACGGGYTALGENVGVGPASASGVSAEAAAQNMINAYMNSICHRNAIISPIYTYSPDCPPPKDKPPIAFTSFNLGSSLSSNSQIIFNTMHFWK